MFFYVFYNIESRLFSCRIHHFYVIGIVPLETFLYVFIKVAEQSYAFKT